MKRCCKIIKVIYVPPPPEVREAVLKADKPRITIIKAE